MDDKFIQGQRPAGERFVDSNLKLSMYKITAPVEMLLIGHIVLLLVDSTSSLISGGKDRRGANRLLRVQMW
jgi:hypothetical protein